MTRQTPSTDASDTLHRDCKLFVLDTNVLIHDPSSLFRFHEHDVLLPIAMLEELDDHKKGMSEIARNARQVTRTLDLIVNSVEGSMNVGIPLRDLSHHLANGRLFFQTEATTANLPAGLPTTRVDNQILAVLIDLQERYPGRSVILVSKDINIRIKARLLGLKAQDYFSDKVLADSDLLYTGMAELPSDLWTSCAQMIESRKPRGHLRFRLHGTLCRELLVNQFLFVDGERPVHAIVRRIHGSMAEVETLTDYSEPRNSVWGITARNREQNYALNLLLDPEIDFVTLLGQAGTGKTLLALAAGLTQVLDLKRYIEIIVTRATVPVGEDIGFLPGTEEEKMGPWMGALEDNLEVLNHHEGGAGEWQRAATTDLIRQRIRIKSLSFMRGRTFLNKYLIIDEAQNLTPKQMKTLITRAGPNTKVICLGNIAQIDTPYLTEGSSGLTYVVDRFKDWPHAGHLTLQRGERSRLADRAGEVL